MSKTQTPFGHVVMAVSSLASAAEQSVLPYVQDTVFGQQAGHFELSVGGVAGHGGLGGVFPPSTQAPRVHRPMRVPHSPKSHVVPSGKRHCEPFAGSFFGHSAACTVPLSSPPSGDVAVLGELSPQAPARAAEAEAATSTRASCASGRVRDDTRRE